MISTLLARKQSFDMYLLDTSYCFQIIGGNSSVIQKIGNLGNVPVATCVIVRGELVFGAYKSERSRANLHLVKQFFDDEDIEVYGIDKDTADIYGELKAAILTHFGPKEKAKRRRAKTETLGFNENDLWIAAVAKRHGLTIVSADGDFQRLKEVDDLKVEKW